MARSVAEFFAAHAIDGRAYLDGAPEHPRAWVTQVHGALPQDVAYCVCHSLMVGIRLLPGETLLSAVPWKRSPKKGRPLGSADSKPRFRKASRSRLTSRGSARHL